MWCPLPEYIPFSCVLGFLCVSILLKVPFLVKCVLLLSHAAVYCFLIFYTQRQLFFCFDQRMGYVAVLFKQQKLNKGYLTVKVFIQNIEKIILITFNCFFRGRAKVDKHLVLARHGKIFILKFYNKILAIILFVITKSKTFLSVNAFKNQV